MIVDASAILAILLDEADAEIMEDVLLRPRTRHVMSPVNYLEAAVRLDSLPDSRKGDELDPLMASLNIDLVPVTPEQASAARQAYRAFGKGRHAARLNLGDCFAYALAKKRGEPLLFKGDDFGMTDVEAAI